MKRSVIRWMILSVIVMAFSAASFGQIAVGISVRIGPPALPVYAQPICPGPGYLWTPGYWAWNDDGGYYWVPGTWVVAPVGMLWTPGYWGWGGGFYAWHAGYWGPRVGFYGGINYGFGFGGVGFVGGEWRGGGFYYNRSVTNVSVTNVTNVYNKTVVVNNTTVNNVSYNGGNGGVQAHPSAQEEAYSHEQHTAPLPVQSQHAQLAAQNRQNFASVNQGRPTIAATSKPGDFSSHSAVAARAAGAAYHAPAMSPKEARVSSPAASHPVTTNASRGNNEGFRPFTPPAKSSSGNAMNNHNNVNRGNSQNNEGFHSFTPPANNNHGNTNQNNQSRFNESRPQSQPHQSAPATHQSAPHSSPPPPPHHQAPPPKEEHRGKA